MHFIYIEIFKFQLGRYPDLATFWEAPTFCVMLEGGLETPNYPPSMTPSSVMISERPLI